MASSPINKSLLANGAANENNNLLLKNISRPTIHDFAALQAALSASTSNAANLVKIPTRTNHAVNGNSAYKSDIAPVSIPPPIATSQLQMTKHSPLPLSPIAPTITPLPFPPGSHNPAHINHVANMAAAAAARSALGQLLKSHQLMGGAGFHGGSQIGLGGPRPGSGGDGMGSIPSSGVSPGSGCQLQLRGNGPCFCSSCSLQKVSMSSLSLPHSSGSLPGAPPPTFSTPTTFPSLGQMVAPGMLPLPLLPNPGMLPLVGGGAGLLPPMMSAGLYGPAGPHSPFFDGGLHPSAADWVALGRRKNATRETTAALKSWLQDHLKNPYPTKGEKVMLAIITKMSLTQVSTWFANARRRLKKEGKMTWTPRNSYDDDEDDEMDDDDDVTALDDDSRSVISKASRPDESSTTIPKPHEVLRVHVNEDDEGYNDDLFTPKDSSTCNATPKLPLSTTLHGNSSPGHPYPGTLVKCKLPLSPFTNPIGTNKPTLLPNSTLDNINLSSHSSQSAFATHANQISGQNNVTTIFSNHSQLSTPVEKPRRKTTSNGSKFWSIVDTVSKNEPETQPAEKSTNSPLHLSPTCDDPSPEPLTISETNGAEPIAVSE